MKKSDVVYQRCPYPKFEFSDLIFTKTVVEGHDFIDQDDEWSDNMVVCKNCKLKGWIGYDLEQQKEGPPKRVKAIKSYKPNQRCKNG